MPACCVFDAGHFLLAPMSLNLLIEHIDFDALVERFFFDADFLSGYSYPGEGGDEDER